MDLAWPQTATACSYMLHSTIQKLCFEAPFKFQNFIVNFFCMVFLRILTCDAALHHQAVLQPPPLQGPPPVQPHLGQSVQVDMNSFILYGSQSIEFHYHRSSIMTIFATLHNWLIIRLIFQGPDTNTRNLWKLSRVWKTIRAQLNPKAERRPMPLQLHMAEEPFL